MVPHCYRVEMHKHNNLSHTQQQLHLSVSGELVHCGVAASRSSSRSNGSPHKGRTGTDGCGGGGACGIKKPR